MAGLIVHHDCRLPVSRGVVQDQAGPQLADGGGGQARGGRGVQDGLLIQVVASEMFIDVAQHGIALKKWRQGRPRAGNRKSGVDHVAEGAGVTQHVTGCHGRGIWSGEGWKQGVAVGKGHAPPEQRRHGRRRLFIEHARTQSVRHEQQHVVRPLRLGLWPWSRRLRGFRLWLWSLRLQIRRLLWLWPRQLRRLGFGVPYQ